MTTNPPFKRTSYILETDASDMDECPEQPFRKYIYKPLSNKSIAVVQYVGDGEDPPSSPPQDFALPLTQPQDVNQVGGGSTDHIRSRSHSPSLASSYDEEDIPPRRVRLANNRVRFVGTRTGGASTSRETASSRLTPRQQQSEPIPTTSRNTDDYSCCRLFILQESMMF